jgi:chromosome segregation ATPase
MPVTARLSRKFYDTFGDEIANEFVEWFNAVDATYRSELRELNELNFARFDAKLEQRIAEVKAELREEIATLRADLSAEMHEGFASLRTEIASLRTEAASLRSELVKWMFLFWAGTALTVIGLMRF